MGPRCIICPECRRAETAESFRAEVLGDDPVAARSVAARIWDRTPGTAPAVQMANQR